MNDAQLVRRLRGFLLAMASFMCLATLVELILVEHTEGVIQWIPFGLCGLALAGIGAAAARPHRATIWGLRGSMVIVGLGSLFGLYEHISNNIAFALEIRPGAVPGDVLWEALGGANPLLAPGILGLAALMGLAATYYHPSLTD